LAKYFWSVIAVDSIHYRVSAEPDEALSAQSGDQARIQQRWFASLCIFAAEKASERAGWKLASDAEGLDLSLNLPFLWADWWRG